MRVISGSTKGHKLITPKGLGTRPTSDRVKEALFNIISDKVVGARVLDLYAGSGALGIEALSRGAQKAVFVDSSAKAVEAICENLNKTFLSKKAVALKMTTQSFLKNFSSEKEQFELIFLDPPYKIESGMLNSIFKELVLKDVLSENGLIILEHSSKRIPEQTEEKLGLKFTRKYGDASLSFYGLT
ncbi:16S rRNA (guanine(966)-N(2))-methyltransferase RsmD [Candidatus Oleimmundimicrobium sp.]|uniref:16S rRNA (guanine(966)-N(2))-methyltransferase RsmD n=1 Tax=Candidatus Oleimmundimicrobium sp. TaxID=3060597 RepID=UPI0027157F14|nr:16S rRNA (guanine(966)-N(2))-methyltransferase RsmD [Candidatus Oleimmundimicrobium sp.]MDO8885343.1 16S rRNA (guanine(966)-N(2))-methyltransferase RsmD [Candidatus Oleimmundimicrobium sp.]